MKLLCVSDQIDPAVYSTTAKKRFSDIDAILCAGDLPMDYIDFIVTTLNKPAYFVFGNHNLGEFNFYHKHPTLISVPAHSYAAETSINHCHGAEYLGFRTHRAQELQITDPATGKTRPLLLAGISGSKRYNNGLNQYTEQQMRHKLLMMWPHLIANKLKYGRYLDIFLTHAPPRHIHDQEDPCHQGFECFNTFIEKFMPAWVVHGHIHLYDLRAERVTVKGSTTIVNAFGYYIIEIPS